ncbi:MAG: divergent polysaccharide deacetylase family protein, partial [Treponemataceae bacterium]|nr:divergent polysaccharide deacetylase family protein [Treponemataceae bacterium]
SSRWQEAERPLLVEREVPQTNAEVVETPQSKSKEDFKVPPKPVRAETPAAKIEKSEKAVNRNDGAKKNSASKKIEENAQNERSKQVAKNPLPPPKKSKKKSDEKNAASKNQSSAAPQDFGFPPASKNAVLCVVFDDGGQNVAQLKKCIALPFPVTVAVLPRLAHSKECAALVRQSGNEVILHQPMQAINLGVNPGEGAILPQMSGGEIAATLSQNIAELAPISGINNHEGSLITEDEVKVGFVLETVHQKGIYFLDSRTSSATKIPSVAMEMGFSYFQRDIFLDNEKSRENILNELKRGVEIANRQGFVIMIGHVWSAEILPSVLEEVYPELKKKGYRFSTVSNSGAQRK